MNQDINILHVRVNSPEKVIWEGDAQAVSSTNSRGPFDILPMHTNFISIIENKPIIIRTESDKKEYHFARSVIYTRENKVLVYTNI